MNNYTVYAHINKINNKIYIGITKQKPEKRWGHNGYKYKNNQHFYRAIQKYGWNNFEHEIVAEHLTEHEAKNFEIILINALETQNTNNGYNRSKGGDGGGYEITLNTREKMRKAKSGIYNGDNNPMYGISPIDRMDNKTYQDWLYKHQHPKECGFKYYTIKIICITTNEIFESVIDASKKYNIQNSDITTCCKRKLCSAGKHPETGVPMVWQYYDDYINGIKPKTREYKKIICYNSGEIFNTAREAGKKYNVPSSNITLCCQGKYKKAGKLSNGESLTWKYLSDII